MADTPIHGNREHAQERADRINAFREELSCLEQERILVLTEEQRERLTRHHQDTLGHLSKQFDVDTSATQRQMSLGMRVVSFLGSLALAASAFFFFYRIWGLISTSTQMFILIGAPIVAVLAMEVMSKKETNPYFTSLVGLVAFACFVLNISVLGSVFNITPSQNAFLVWAAFGFLLAYAYRPKLLLVAGILCLFAFLSATVGTWCGNYWLSFGMRPENFIPAGFFLFAIPLIAPHQAYADFPRYYRIFGLLSVLIALLILSNWGEGSYLMWPSDGVEALYQILGFFVSGSTIWMGIRQHWPEVTNVGATFFALQLYTKFFDWWWEWMPKYLFFLILGLIAILLLLIFKRLRAYLVQVAA